MTRLEFAQKLLKVLGSNYPDYPVDLYSDTHKDGTKVLRIKAMHPLVDCTNEEATNTLTNYLADVSGIKKVTVRNCRDNYSGLDWCIQVEYVGSLPDLNNPKLVVPTPEPEIVESRTDNGLIKVETPFGIGYATDEADKARMMLWLEGVKAGMAYIKASQDIIDLESQTVESPDPEADFDVDLAEIDADHASEWWINAEELRAKYPTIDDETAEEMMQDAFNEWR